MDQILASECSSLGELSFKNTWLAFSTLGINVYFGSDNLILHAYLANMLIQYPKDHVSLWCRSIYCNICGMLMTHF